MDVDCFSLSLVCLARCKETGASYVELPTFKAFGELLGESLLVK
jgi:hypothetical protein